MPGSDNHFPVQVAPMDPARKNSKVAKSISDADTVSMSRASKHCYWNDTEFEPDDHVCDRGTCYECSLGYWVMLDESC